jgi:hypothetical protein
MQRRAIVKTIKVAHRYLGLFFAPAIIFFSFSGALQTLGLHEVAQGNGHVPARWLLEMAQIHKKQTLVVTASKIKTPTNDPAAAHGSSAKKKAPVGRLALQVFVVLMSVALMATTILGMIMAFMYGGDPRITALALVAGILFPISVMLL